MAILDEIYQRACDHRQSLNGRENFLELRNRACQSGITARTRMQRIAKDGTK